MAVGGGEGQWEGGEGTTDIAPQGVPFLIAPLASVYLIRHDQQNRGGERRWGQTEGWRGRGPGIDGTGQTGSNFSVASRHIPGAGHTSRDAEFHL